MTIYKFAYIIANTYDTNMDTNTNSITTINAIVRMPTLRPVSLELPLRDTYDYVGVCRCVPDCVFVVIFIPEIKFTILRCHDLTRGSRATYLPRALVPCASAAG